VVPCENKIILKNFRVARNLVGLFFVVMLCFIFGFLPSFYNCIYYTSYSNNCRPIYDCICIVFSLAFVLSCVCQLVLKNYDDDDDDEMKQNYFSG